MSEHQHRLRATDERWKGDDGAPDADVRAALAAASDRDEYLRAVAVLCGARLLLPIVATGDDGRAGPDLDRKAELAAVKIVAPDGTTALLAFTGLDSLRSWEPRARPVPCTLDEVAATAGEAGATHVVIDLAGPAGFEIGPDLLAQLALGHRLVQLDAGGFGWLTPAPEREQSTG